MDTFLSLGDFIEREEFQENSKLALWIVEDGFVRPSAELKVKGSLDPGVYIIDSNRDYGIFCKQIDACSDELFLFNNDVVSNLMKDINSFWSKADVYKANNLTHKRGILLEGYAGTGKTSLISLLSKEVINSGGIVFKITSPKNLYFYSVFVKDYFRKIQPDTNIITIIEDIDSYMDFGEDLLDLLDGRDSINHNLFIATTNNTEELDDVFLRPSRIDLRVIIPLPDEDTRRQYLEHKGVSNEVIDSVIDFTEGFSLADLKEFYICVFILDYSVEDAINKINKFIKKKDYKNKNTRKSLSM